MKKLSLKFISTVFFLINCRMFAQSGEATVSGFIYDSTTGETLIGALDWINIWFYGNYRIIVYACDENFRLYVLTYKNVQEFDGNFHEPRINIDGDGIGIFGSAIADTVYLKVKK